MSLDLIRNRIRILRKSDPDAKFFGKYQFLINIQDVMVLILYGSPVLSAYVQGQFGNLICLRHSLTTITVAKGDTVANFKYILKDFFSLKVNFVNYKRSNVNPKYKSTMSSRFMQILLASLFCQAKTRKKDCICTSSKDKLPRPVKVVSSSFRLFL